MRFLIPILLTLSVSTATLEAMHPHRHRHHLTCRHHVAQDPHAPLPVPPEPTDISSVGIVAEFKGKRYMVFQDGVILEKSKDAKPNRVVAKFYDIRDATMYGRWLNQQFHKETSYQPVVIDDQGNIVPWVPKNQ